MSDKIKLPKSVLRQLVNGALESEEIEKRNVKGNKIGLVRIFYAKTLKKE